MARFAIVKAKASGMDWTRSLRPEKEASSLTWCSIEVSRKSRYDQYARTRYEIYRSEHRRHSHLCARSRMYRLQKELGLLVEWRGKI